MIQDGYALTYASGLAAAYAVSENAVYLDVQRV